MNIERFYYFFLGIKMEKEDFLLKINKELKKYSNIPNDLCNYIINGAEKDTQEHLIPVISTEKERRIILEKVDNLFNKSSNITKLSPVKILKALDFHSKDVSLGRIDAVFAELRTIIFLNHNLNLYNITPLKAKKDEKSADFIAKGNSNKYAIEVFCRISQFPPQTVEELKKDLETTKIMIEPSTYEDDLFRDYINISKTKKIQLDNTAEKYLCNKKIMVMVLNDLNILGLLTYYEYLDILNKIFTDLDWGSNYHFAIVTGMTTLGIDIVEDVIYPQIT
jgi:hypothetical protein